MSGQLAVSADLGIPQLPGQDSSSSTLSLLTGSHTINLSYADPAHYRLALQVPLGETDMIRDGSTAWIWQSSSDSVTQLTLPANAVPGAYGMAGQGASGPVPARPALARSPRSRRFSNCSPRSGRAPASPPATPPRWRARTPTSWW